MAVIYRLPCGLDDYKIAELLSGEQPLIPTEGFYDASAPGGRCAEMRDVFAMRMAWAQHGQELLELWNSGWPGTKFAGGGKCFDGLRIGMPPGWRRFRSEACEV